MKDTVTLKELVALIIRKGRLCICLAVIFGLLLGGLGVSKKISDMNSPKNTPEKVEEHYQEKVDEYHRKHAELQSNYTHKKNQLAAAIEYQQNSLLCKIDPSDKIVAQSVLSVTNIAKKATSLKDISLDSLNQTTELDILSHYDTMWVNADLKESLKIDVLDTYLREVITLTIKDEILLKVTAVASTEDEAKTLHDAALKFLQNQTDIISDTYCSHDLVVLSTSIKASTDYEATEPSPQQKIQKTIIDLQNQIIEAENELKDLTEPPLETPINIVNIIVNFVLQFVLGGIIGVIIGAVFVIVQYLFGSRLTHITCVEQQFPNCFAISLSLSKNWFERTANKLLGERVWKTQEQSLAYLQEALKVRFTDKDTVALVTTLSSANECDEFVQIKQLLEQCGCRVVVADNAYYNSEAIRAMSEADKVVMIEQYNNSKTNEIEATLALVAERGKALESLVTF